MSLSIIYHIYKNSKTLEASLQSLLDQTDNNFELALVNDGAMRGVTQILKNINIHNFKHLTYCKWNQNVGHSISFNTIIHDTKSEYVHYSGSNAIFDKDFVKKINLLISKHKPDVISFNEVNADGSIQEFKKNNTKMNMMLHLSMRDKIYRTQLLRDNNIYLNENAYFPLVFVYQILMAYKKWIIVDDVSATYQKNTTFTYNLYDIFDQNDYLLENYRNSTFWKSVSDVMEFFMILYVINVFLPRIFDAYRDKQIRKQAIAKANEWLNHNIPQWRKNKILNSNKNIQPELTNKFAKIKFSLYYLVKFFKQNNL